MASKAVRLVLLVSLCLTQVKTQYRRWKRSPSLFPAAIDLIVCPAGGTLLLLFLLKTRSKAHVPAWRDRWGNPGSPCSFLSPLSIAPTEEIPQEVHRTFQKKKIKKVKKEKKLLSAVFHCLTENWITMKTEGAITLFWQTCICFPSCVQVRRSFKKPCVISQKGFTLTMSVFSQLSYMSLRHLFLQQARQRFLKSHNRGCCGDQNHGQQLGNGLLSS